MKTRPSSPPDSVDYIARVRICDCDHQNDLENSFLPRPFIQSQKAFHLEGDQLVESQRLSFRVPFDKDSQRIIRLREGDIFPNDLGSFPSDHAGFYLTLAVGIWLASRWIGCLRWRGHSWSFSAAVSSRGSILRWNSGRRGHRNCDLAAVSVGRWQRIAKLLEPIALDFAASGIFQRVDFYAIFEAANTLQNFANCSKPEWQSESN